jgi:hypothetical protein
MENLTFGRILILLLFLLWPLLHWLLGQVRRRRRATRPRAEQPTLSPFPAGTEKIGARVETKSRRERAAAAPTPKTAARRSRSQAMRRLLTDNREVRRGIISLTVLGPCRALEAPE